MFGNGWLSRRWDATMQHMACIGLWWGARLPVPLLQTGRPPRDIRAPSMQSQVMTREIYTCLPLTGTPKGGNCRPMHLKLYIVIAFSVKVGTNFSCEVSVIQLSRDIFITYLGDWPIAVKPELINCSLMWCFIRHFLKIGMDMSRLLMQVLRKQYLKPLSICKKMQTQLFVKW